MTRRTQADKILRAMLSHPEKQWWYAPDFMQDSFPEGWVGYEASARLSELAKGYPDLIESRRRPGEEKYLERRIRWENSAASAAVPPELTDLFSAGAPRRASSYEDDRKHEGDRAVPDEDTTSGSLLRRRRLPMHGPAIGAAAAARQSPEVDTGEAGAPAHHEGRRRRHDAHTGGRRLGCDKGDDREGTGRPRPHRAEGPALDPHMRSDQDAREAAKERASRS